ncbi:MAG TPA: serine hydrolase [Longimicrobiaceae bacterium]|nr:serine hydrolase [Longimicrobiaceae bacterium]
MTAKEERGDALAERIEAIADEAGAGRAAVSYYDYETREAWSHRGGEWFHAASTIKVPILLGVFGAVHRRGLTPDSRVHVRNRFLSAVDGEPYRVEQGRDANSVVHQQLGRTMKVGELAYHMIVTSSNLATNLLVDLVGLDAIRESLGSLGVCGVELRRGVEDERAWERGINNRVTACGLVSVLRPIEEGTAFSVELSARMLEILHDQEFRSGIPAGVPDGARVANKTGEISTVAHDAAIVYLPGRKPYAVVVLTEWEPAAGTGRSDTIARISRAVYEHLVPRGAPDA